MILFDGDGAEYEVPDEVAIKRPKPTQRERLRSLIIDVVAEAVRTQRIVTNVEPHETLVNCGTADLPRIERVRCNAQPAVAVKIEETLNPESLAATIIARVEAHGFVKREDLDATDESLAPARAAKRQRSHLA